jgi:hypothetical protein
LPTAALARAPKQIPVPTAELAARLKKGSEVTLRMLDRSKVSGKVQATDAAGLTIKPHRKPARTIAWSEVAGVNIGPSRATLLAFHGLLWGGLGTIGLVASGAPPQKHPLESVGIGMMGASVLPLILSRSTEYQPR